jgi:ribose/xylose/arabinose/galactoside ABC-type transport system permease subunit
MTENIKKPNRNLKIKLPNQQSLILLFSIVLIVLCLSIFVDNFATPNNLRNIFVQVSPIGIMAFGLTFVMVSGGIDISLPAIMAASAVISADYIAKTGNIFIGSILFLLIGGSLGLINGIAVAYLKMVPLVVTLSMMTICMGIATAWVSGDSVSGLPENFSLIFNDTIVIIIFIGVAFLLGILLKKTEYGRWLFYIGNNENTSSASGLPVKRAVCIAYVIAGICAGVAGIFNTSALSSARASMGPETQILDVVTAAVIGGVSVRGGVGNILGVFFGAILIIIINNVLNLLGVSDYYTGLIKGMIIILAMGIDAARVRYSKS